LKLKVLEDDICIVLKLQSSSSSSSSLIDSGNFLTGICFSKNDSTQRYWEKYTIGTPIYAKAGDVIRFWNKNDFLSRKNEYYQIFVTRGNENSSSS